MEPTIEHLVYYPIKGADGIKTQVARITQTGLSVDGHKDHEYMIVHANPTNGIHSFVSQKHTRTPTRERHDFSVLARIKPWFYDNTLILSWMYEDKHIVPPIKKTILWASKYEAPTSGYDQGNDVAEWLSNHIGADVRLIRSIRPQLARNLFTPEGHHVRYQDDNVLHWITQESVSELSEIAGQEIAWQRFRPQIVVCGMKAQEEHKVYEGDFGAVKFLNVKPTTRCRVPCVNQENGEVDINTLLKTLMSYKQWKSSEGNPQAIFGEYALPLSEGIIKVGDSLLVLSHRNPPLTYGGKDI